MFIPMLMPMIPTWNEKPPTLYSILESIVNFDKEDKTKIKDLAKVGRSTIFNFTYPLSNKIVKEDFECMILNHFIMRRIGFETVTAFRMQLNVKLNEIMPVYNKMFDMLEDWDIFNDGEKVTREVTDSRNIKTTSESTTENSQNTSNDNITSTDTTSSNTLNNDATTTGQNTSDNRNSDTPQNRLSEVRSGEYVDDYKYTQDNSSSTDKSKTTGSSTSSTDTTNNTSIETEGQTSSNSKDNTENKGNTKETIIRTPSDKLKLYQDFIENRQNIYTMIFKDLEDLFYQLV